jgi:predicted AlkP superfamily pyrophosphatase or phosphodiesterase
MLSAIRMGPMVRSASVPRIHRLQQLSAFRRSALAVALGAVLAVGGSAAADGRAVSETVILISLDGTTPAQIADPGLATLARLRREGAHAALIPVFPTNTFPNHVSLVTGVLPEQHGIVSNVFVDPERGKHSYENDPSWMQAEPLWSLLARHGIVSAAFYWVGSQGPWASGLGPRHWKPFDGRTPEREKVDQILAWLDLEDPAERPRLVTSWFHGADSKGHRGGPDAPEVAEALREQDAELGRLVAGIESRGLADATTLLIVSDHGMAPVERAVDLAGELDDAGVPGRVLGGGGFALVKSSDAAGVVRVARGLGLEAWPHGATPPELPTDNPRFADVVVVAPLGTAITRQGLRGTLQRLLAKGGKALGGSHGHRPEHPAMRGIFLAWGAGIPAAGLGEVSALDVAPTVLALFGIAAPPHMEGRALFALPSAP